MSSNPLSYLSQLSFWAKKHQIAARLLIAFSRIIMGYYAFYWGAILADIDKDFSNSVFLVSACVYLIGFIFYPRNKERRSFSLTRQKVCDGLLVISSCAFWLAAGNYTVHWQPKAETETAQIEVLQSAIGKNGKPLVYPSLEHSNVVKKVDKKREGLFKKLKNIKIGFFKKLKARVMVKLALIKSAYRQLDGEQIALLILASLAIIAGLGYLTLVLSCNLSCNGQEGAATAVALFGCAFTVGAVAWMWTSAVKKNKYKTVEPMRKNKQPPNRTGAASSTGTVQMEVQNQNLQVCLTTDDPKGLSGVNIHFNDKLLMENIHLGKVPLCVDLTVQLDMANPFVISGAEGPVKLAVEDGKFSKRVTLPMEGVDNGSVDLILKGN